MFFISMPAFAPDVFPADEAFQSKYTSLVNCKSIVKPGKPDENGPNDWSVDKCPGREGWNVYVEGGDVRSWLIIKKGNDVIDLQGTGGDDVFFPMIIGQSLEWRYKMSGAKKELSAIIFRMGGQDKESGKEIFANLYVVRLAKDFYCLAGKDKTNEGARAIADGDKQCAGEKKTFKPDPSRGDGYRSLK